MRSHALHGLARGLACLTPAVWAGVTIGAGFVAVPAIFAVDAADKPQAYAAAARVFERLATAEWLAAAVLLAALALLRFPRKRGLAVLATLAILAFQATWLRPELIARAEMLAAGASVQPSPAHGVFATLETVKLLLLLGLAYASSRADKSQNQSSA